MGCEGEDLLFLLFGEGLGAVAVEFEEVGVPGGFGFEAGFAEVVCVVGERGEEVSVVSLRWFQGKEG